MSGGNVSFIHGNFEQLRNRMEEVSQVEFKKKLMGGFDEEDVIKHFKTLGEQIQKTEENFKVRIDEIEHSKKKLQDDLEAHKDKFCKAVAKVDELNKVIKRLEKEKEALQKELENTANNDLDSQLVRERDELANVQLQLEQRLNSENSGLTTWMSGIKNDMEFMCRQLGDLEEMSNANNQLKQQLMQERARAEKAEKDLADFGQLVSELQSRVKTKF